MLTALVLIFIVAYAAIALEHPLGVNKSASALIGAGLEHWAVEFRHLQRTEVLEAEEPFTAAQKGSVTVWQWNTTVNAGCGSCHGAAPNDPVHTSVSKSAPATACNPCHSTVVNTSGGIVFSGTGTSATTLHINGARQTTASCFSCHGDQTAGSIAPPGRHRRMRAPVELVAGRDRELHGVVGVQPHAVAVVGGGRGGGALEDRRGGALALHEDVVGPGGQRDLGPAGAGRQLEVLLAAHVSVLTRLRVGLRTQARPSRRGCGP